MSDNVENGEKSFVLFALTQKIFQANENLALHNFPDYINGPFCNL